MTCFGDESIEDAWHEPKRKDIFKNEKRERFVMNCQTCWIEINAEKVRSSSGLLVEADKSIKRDEYTV